MDLELDTWNNLSNILKNLIQIGFFFLTGVLAYFSYRHAKKSLFSPMKNEIFKKQVLKLEEFKESYGRITSEDDLFTAHRFEEIFIYNWMKLFAKLKEPDTDPNLLLDTFRRRMFIELSGPETVESRIFPGYYRDIEGKIPKLELSHNYINISNSLKEIITSNLIPAKIQRKAEKLQDSTENILKEIVTYLESNVSEIKITDDNNIEGAMKGYYNFHPSKTDLYDQYRECINSIREYLNTDKIMN